MHDLTLNLPKDARPHYLKIADSVREAILQGRIRPGEKLPSSRALAQELRAHRQTVMAAMEELIAEGWISSEARRRYRICDTLPHRFFEPLKNEGSSATTPHRFRLAREGEVPSLPLLSSQRYAFLSGMPDLRLFPVHELRSCLSDVLSRSPEKALNYDEPTGHQLLREQLEIYLRRVRAVQDREIVITNGSQEAIFLLAQTLIRPGDEVGVEEQGYAPAWEAFRAAGARLVPLKIDEEGLSPDGLKRTLKKHRLRMIYLTPLHQYPTTVTLPVSRRLQIYGLAERHGIPLLEDDYDHEFHYRCQPLAPLAADDPAGLVLYVSTFSKVLFPSARLGFMAIPRSLAKPLSHLKRISSRQNDGILQAALGRWMKQEGFERHLRRMRRRYEERRDKLVECLERARNLGYSLEWKCPDGGMALWLDVKQDAQAVAERAERRGVTVIPGSRYHLRPGPSQHLRLGFANQTPAEIKEGFERLLEALK